MISGRDKYCKEQLEPQLLIWGRSNISQEPIWVQVMLNKVSLRGGCWKGGVCNKAEGLMEQAVSVLCSPR